MFDAMFSGRDESALIAEIERAAQEEARAGARKLAAIAELAQSTVTYDEERDDWVYDSWAAAACELGAVLNIGRTRASGQMRIAVALRDRLPQVAALYLQGRLSARLVAEITWRTRLVEDEQVSALLDSALAEKAVRWGPLSEERLTRSIDTLVNRYDPDAVIRARDTLRSRDFHIGSFDDPDELVTVYGQLLGCDAAVLSERMELLLKELCDNDPRTLGERRSCAVGALIQRLDHLPCRCGSPDCAAATPANSNVVISVLADPAAVEAARNLIAAEDREQQAESADETPVEPQPEPGRDAETSCPRPQDEGVALLPGVKIVPTVALAEAIRHGAQIKQLWVPGPDPEPHYRPSTKLAAFVRARDLFCRFPGCDVRAERCDIDHVVPWPYGPTHASNLNCKCRTHHLAKTFDDGWRDEQLPDGTVIWTTPARQRYTTVPGSRLFFPSWSTTTTELPPMDQPPQDPDRSAKMPKRRRTRASDRAARIKAERADNATQRALAEQEMRAERPPPDG